MGLETLCGGTRKSKKHKIKVELQKKKTRKLTFIRANRRKRRKEKKGARDRERENSPELWLRSAIATVIKLNGVAPNRETCERYPLILN